MLIIGKKYSLYTAYESIVGQKVEVIGILKYSECSKISYDMSVLAINERVISVKDEDLESEIGDDNIYWCRSINANVDGSFNEFLVWDSIINFDKTATLAEKYSCTLSITLDTDSNYSVSQIIDTIQNSVKSTYGGNVDISTTTPVIASNSKNGSGEDKISDEQIENVKSIINEINMWENKLIPAVQAIESTDLATKITNIQDSLTSILSDVALIKHGL